MQKSLNGTCRMERVAFACTSVGFLLMSGGVIACILYLLLTMASLVMASPAAAQSAPVAAGVRLEAGIEKEDVDGDLKSAMDIYQKIAADASAPRDVRAKALLRLAGCEEKLGKQARQVYEQIVRDYSDQPAAAQARTRLAAIRQQDHPSPPATMATRRIEWAKLGNVTAYDTDGERATFIGPDGNLFFGDLAGHHRQLVFALSANDRSLLGAYATRDFSTVALVMRAASERPFILAEVKIDGTGYRELIRDDQRGVFGNAMESMVDRGNISWSWDNRYLAVTTRPPGEDSRLVVVDVSNGSYRELVRSGSDWLSSVRFSPDGRFIAYQATPQKFGSGTISVCVVPVRGGEPHLVQEFPQMDNRKFFDLSKFLVLKDWTADGHYLITREARQGKSALYLLPIKDGAAIGPSEFVRFGDFDEAHTTLSGALIYQDHAATPTDVASFLASMDSYGHIDSWRGLDLRGGLNGNYPCPSFSPDGNQIAYIAGDADPKQTDLVIRDLSTGQQRTVYHSSDGMLTCQYSSKKPKVFCTLTGRDLAAWKKTDLFSVDDKTGTVEEIASLHGGKFMLHNPDDGRTFYLLDVAENKFAVTRWDLGTQEESVIVPRLDDGETLELPSSDGRWLLRRVMGKSLSVRPIPGGEWRTIVSGVKSLDSGDDTTQDGNWAFYWANDSTGKAALFRVPTTGGAPERVGDLPNASFRYLFTLSADGRQILATNWGPQKYDLWLLENFEPKR
jgi:Tol biopolymer transport system component